MQKIDTQGFVLSVKRFGEKDLLLSLFTPEHGRYVGLTTTRHVPMVASFVTVSWQARLSEHLGRYTIKDAQPLSALYMNDPQRLAALSGLCALMQILLPERENQAKLYQQLTDFLSHLDDEDWLAHYARLEVALLSAIGFGLDLSKCALGGPAEHLAFVSPKTGRAVSREKADPYKDRLLPLPAFLYKETPATAQDIKDALTLTAYFLQKQVTSLPPTRLQLVKYLSK